MSELRIVMAVILGLITFASVRYLPAYVLIWGIVVVLNVINVFVTGINLWQARANDKRFLHAGWLGLIGFFTGLGLYAFFSLIWDHRRGILIVSVPYMAGGLLTLLTCLVYYLIRKKQNSS